MSKKKVLLIGAEPERMIRLRRTYDSLIGMNIQVRVLNPSRSPRGSPRILKGIVRYLMITLQVLFTKADIYHFFNVPDIIGLPLALKRGVVIYDIRAPWAISLEETFGKSPLVKIAEAIERLMIRFANRILCVNSLLAQRAYDLGARTVTVISNFPASDFGPSRDRNEFRKMLGLSDSPTVLYIGKLSIVEGSALLMDVISKTCKENPDVQFVVVGAGPEEEALKDFIRCENLQERVKYVGWVPHEDVANYINAADICLLPRKRDGLSPYVAAESIWKVGEYLVMDKPVIVPRFGGFTEAAYPIISVDPSEMHSAIIDFIESPKKPMKSHHPRWTESDKKLHRLYESLGAI